MKIYKKILILLPAMILTYGQAVSQEKVFVHTDRDIYVAGEDMLFSLFSHQKGDQSHSSIVAYLELININNTAVAQSRTGITGRHGHGVMNIPDSLTTGKYTLRAYTRFMRNYGPGIFYTKSIIIYNPFKENGLAATRDSIHKGMDRQVQGPETMNISYIGDTATLFSTREKVTVRFQVDTSAFKDPRQCNISISVAVSSGEKGENDISSVLQDLETGLTLPGSDKYLYPESTGPYLEGSVLARDTREIVNDRRLYLSFPGKSPFLQYSETDSNGNFSFLLPPFTGSRELIIQPSGFSNDYIIKTLSSFAAPRLVSDIPEAALSAELLDYASRLGVNYQVNRIYELEHGGPEIITVPDSSNYRFYGKPEVEVYLDDYIDLPTMEEVFHELVPGVALRGRAGDARFVFTSEPGSPTLKGPDAVFLDGVILDDPSFIAVLDPDLIERIDVIRSPYQIGRIIFNGIISIISKEGDMCGIDYPDAGLRTSLDFMDRDYTYNNFSYDADRRSDPLIPDFRNTLYWNPSIKPDREGIIEFTFYTSDFLSDYLICIQGLTDSKEALVYSKQIRVVR
jgi:hypothetical protein